MVVDLAGAVGPEEAEDLALLDLEADPGQRVHRRPWGTAWPGRRPRRRSAPGSATGAVGQGRRPARRCDAGDRVAARVVGSVVMPPRSSSGSVRRPSSADLGGRSPGTDDVSPGRRYVGTRPAHTVTRDGRPTTVGGRGRPRGRRGAGGSLTATAEAGAGGGTRERPGAVEPVLRPSPGRGVTSSAGHARRRCGPWSWSVPCWSGPSPGCSRLRRARRRPSTSANQPQATGLGARRPVDRASTSSRGVTAHADQRGLPGGLPQLAGRAGGLRPGRRVRRAAARPSSFYVDQINRTGGINGRTIDPIIVDLRPDQRGGHAGALQDLDRGLTGAPSR